MSKINTTPKGLQELLGNSAQGINPSELSGVVQPQTDLFPFWSVDRLEIAQVVASVTTPGNGAVAKVPEGEMWSMVGVGCRITGMTAGDVVRLGIYVVGPGNLQLALVRASQTLTFAGPLERLASGYFFNRNFMLPAGWQLWALCDELQIAAPAESLTMTYSYYKILV